MSAVNLLVTFYDIHVRKGEVLFFSPVPVNTRDDNYYDILKFGTAYGTQAILEQGQDVTGSKRVTKNAVRL
jgi:hypothetical protein